MPKPETNPRTSFSRLHRFVERLGLPSRRPFLRGACTILMGTLWIGSGVMTARAQPFNTSELRQFLLVGMGPDNDNGPMPGIGKAVNVNNDWLGKTNSGTCYDGNIAVTNDDGVFDLQDVNVYADLGIYAEQSGNNADDGSSNSKWQHAPGTPLKSIPGSGLTGNRNFTNLLNEVDSARATIPNLAATQQLNLGGNGGKISANRTINLVSGQNVIDINTDGNDFLIENSTLTVDGPADSYAIFRINPNDNMLISNADIVVGNSGIGLNSVVFWSERSDEKQTAFGFSNTTLMGIAFWALENNGPEINIDNGDGCAQFVADKITLNDVKFCRCAFDLTPTPTPTLTWCTRSCASS